MLQARITAIGDVMCGESFYQYGSGPRTHINRLGEEFLNPKMRAVLCECDAIVANIECPVSNIGYIPGRLRSHHMRADPDVASLLRRWGIRVANLANNHILEHGIACAVDTVTNLEAAGIAVVGAGRERDFRPGFGASVLSLGGLSVAFCGACLLNEKYAFNGGVGPEELLRRVSEIAAKVDAVVVALHWGTEFSNAPSQEQRQFAHRLVDAGATLILGHHPHVLQGIERIGSSVAAYSLGNFIFDQPLAETRASGVLVATLGVCKVHDYSFHTIALNDTHSPVITAEGVGTPPLNMNNCDDAILTATRRQSEFRRSMRRQLRERWHALPLWYRLQVLWRPISRRLGIW